MKARRKGREIALQALYCWQIDPTRDAPPLEFLWLTEDMESDISQQSMQFARLLVNGVCEHLNEIDTLLTHEVKNWSIKRLLEIDKALLRISIFSLCHLDDIPIAVIINEAIEIAKEFSDRKSPQFLNGVLDAIAKHNAPLRKNIS